MLNHYRRHRHCPLCLFHLHLWIQHQWSFFHRHNQQLRLAQPVNLENKNSQFDLIFFFQGPPSGTLCRGVPLCVDVGLNILQQMKAIPGRPGWLYVFLIDNFFFLIVS